MLLRRATSQLKALFALFAPALFVLFAPALVALVALVTLALVTPALYLVMRITLITPTPLTHHPSNPTAVMFTKRMVLRVPR